MQTDGRVPGWVEQIDPTNVACDDTAVQQGRGRSTTIAQESCRCRLRPLMSPHAERRCKRCRRKSGQKVMLVWWLCGLFGGLYNPIMWAHFGVFFGCFGLACAQYFAVEKLRSTYGFEEARAHMAHPQPWPTSSTNPDCCCNVARARNQTHMQTLTVQLRARPDDLPRG